MPCNIISLTKRMLLSWNQYDLNIEYADTAGCILVKQFEHVDAALYMMTLMMLVKVMMIKIIETMLMIICWCQWPLWCRRIRWSNWRRRWTRWTTPCDAWTLVKYLQLLKVDQIFAIIRSWSNISQFANWTIMTKCYSSYVQFWKQWVGCWTDSVKGDSDHIVLYYCASKICHHVVLWVVEMMREWGSSPFVGGTILFISVIHLIQRVHSV